MYAKINNEVVEKFPYSIGLLRKENPNISFPKKPTDTMLSSYGVYLVRETNPTVGENQKLVKSWGPELIDGEWWLNHQAVDMTVEEIADRDAAKSKEVRSQRDNLLSQSDWRVIKAQETGTAMSAEWVDDRQALRDITSHANFPWLDDADWPVKP